MSTSTIPCIYDLSAATNSLLTEKSDIRPTRKIKKSRDIKHKKDRKPKVQQIIELQDYDAYKKFTRHGKCIVEYGAPWCTACMDINPHYITLCKQYGDKIKMGYVNIDKCKLQFQNIPVFVAIHNGKELNSIIGSNQTGLEQLITNLLQL